MNSFLLNADVEKKKKVKGLFDSTHKKYKIVSQIVISNVCVCV